MKKILVPIDFSQQSQDALHVAYQLAQKLKARLQLVHVLEIPLPDDEVPRSRVEVLPMEYMRRAKEGATEQLKALVEQQHISDVKIDYRIQSGNPYRSIIGELIKNPVDLVVMGSKGASGDKEVWVGSNAERIVRLAHCPVLVVKEKLRIDKIKNIVFATTLREYAPEALSGLQELQKALGAQLYLLRVNTLGNFMEDPYVRQRLKELAETHQLKNYTVNTYSDIDEETGIINFAGEVGANLIAMTTRGRRGLMHLLSGSKAEDVTNHTKLPVWTMNLRHLGEEKK